MPEVVPGAQATDECFDPLEQGQPNGPTFGLKGQFRLHCGVGFKLHGHGEYSRAGATSPSRKAVS